MCAQVHWSLSLFIPSLVRLSFQWYIYQWLTCPSDGVSILVINVAIIGSRHINSYSNWTKLKKKKEKRKEEKKKVWNRRWKTDRYQQNFLSHFRGEPKMLSTFWWDKFDSYSRATQFGSRCSVMKIFGARFPPLLNIGAGWNFTGRRFRLSGTSTLVSFLTKFLTLTDLGRGLDWWGTTHWRTGSAIWYEWIQNHPNLKYSKQLETKI